MRTFLLVAATLLVVAGCSPINVPVTHNSGTPDSGGTGQDADSRVSTETTGTETTGTDPDTTPQGSDAGWMLSAHPCVGSRTDTLWFDDPQAAWVGCGAAAEGYGLYRTRDSGKTWSAAATQPQGLLSSFRVSSVSRSADGYLYVAGIQTTGDDRVVRLDTTSEPMPVESVFKSTQKSWNSYHVGTFRRAPNGFAVAESLTGVGAAYRPDDASAWQDAYGWWGGSSSAQILDMTVFDGAFYGCGSTIADVHKVYLPPQAPPAGFQMDVVPLSFKPVIGELWAIDVDASGVVLGGVDQDRDSGMIYVSGEDPHLASSWRVYDLDPDYPGDATWIRGVCRDREKLVAVGEYAKLADGLVLRSTDGGATWKDVTPDQADGTPIPAVQRCKVFSDGSFAMAGGRGFFAFWRP
jgi:hypothetical protein